MTDDQAESAVRRHDEYFYDHVLKMVLGNCVRLFGVRATRLMLLRYARQLKWF